MRVLRQYEGTAFGPQLRKAFQKVRLGLMGRIEVDLGKLSESVTVQEPVRASFDEAVFLKLTQAIEQGRRIEMSYYTAGRAGTS